MARVLFYAPFFSYFMVCSWIYRWAARWLVGLQWVKLRSKDATGPTALTETTKVETWKKNNKYTTLVSTDWLDIIWNDYVSFHFCCQSKQDRLRPCSHLTYFLRKKRCLQRFLSTICLFRKALGDVKRLSDENSVTLTTGIIHSSDTGGLDQPSQRCRRNSDHHPRGASLHLFEVGNIN